jgi:hypothetical protein
LPIGLPITFTFGLAIDCDCDPDAVFTVAFDPEFDCDVWAKAVPPSIVIAVAARRSDFIEPVLHENASGADRPPQNIVVEIVYWPLGAI